MSAGKPFPSAHRNIEVELEDRPSRQIVRAVAEGRADVGIVTHAVDPAEEREIIPVGAIRLVVAAQRNMLA